MTINYARESVIDFTKPFMNLGISILFKVISREVMVDQQQHRTPISGANESADAIIFVHESASCRNLAVCARSLLSGVDHHLYRSPFLPVRVEQSASL